MSLNNPFSKGYFPKNYTAPPPPPPPPPSGSDKYFSGYGVKLEPWQVLKADGTPKISGAAPNDLNTIFQELEDTPVLHGVKWATSWGDIDTGDNPANWDMRIINYLIQRLHEIKTRTGKQKYLLLALSFKSGAIGGLLPPDIRIPGTYPSSKNYTKYKYAWPWVPNAGALFGGGGYHIKAWVTAGDYTLLNRFQSFCEKLANYVVPGTGGKTIDAGDYLCMISTLESATQTPFDPYFPDYTLEKHEDGILELNKRMKLSFARTMVATCLNFTKPNCARNFPKLPALNIGCNTPNMNYSDGLIIKSAYPGVLNYFYDGQPYPGLIVLNPEIQGDDYYATYGIDARRRAADFAKQNPPNWTAVDAEYDFPAYITLHRRCRDTLNANIVIAQRTQPFWNGGVYQQSFKMYDGTNKTHIFPGTRPSFIEFLKTNAEVNADANAGLAPRPTNWL